MEPTTNVSREQALTAGAAKEHSPSTSKKEAAHTTAGNGKSTEIVDHAKQAVTDAYDTASKTVQHGYKQAVDYGRDNPMKTMLMVFGAGVGAGLLIANSAKSAPRDRTSRIVPTVANAVADVVTQIFR
jgi:hypothetical protein